MIEMRTIESFMDCVKDWKLTFMSPTARSAQVAYMLEKVCKPVLMDVCKYAHRLETPARYVKEMPLTDDSLIKFPSQIKHILFRSMPKEWQQAFAHAYANPDACDFTIMVAFMHQEREFDLLKNSRHHQDRHDHQETEIVRRTPTSFVSTNVMDMKEEFFMDNVMNFVAHKTVTIYGSTVI